MLTLERRQGASQRPSIIGQKRRLADLGGPDPLRWHLGASLRLERL